MTKIISAAGFDASAVSRLRRTDAAAPASVDVDSALGFGASRGNKNHNNKYKESTPDELSLSLPNPSTNSTVSLPGVCNGGICLGVANTVNSTAASHASKTYSQLWRELRFEQNAEAESALVEHQNANSKLDSLSEVDAKQRRKSVGMEANKLETLLSSFDRSGSGPTLSLRNISLFSKVASLGAGALDKLIAAMDQEQNGALQLLQSRLAESSHQAENEDRPGSLGVSLLA